MLYIVIGLILGLIGIAYYLNQYEIDLAKINNHFGQSRRYRTYSSTNDNWTGFIVAMTFIIIVLGFTFTQVYG